LGTTAEIRGRGAVDELAGDPPALGLDELPEWKELGVRVLVFIAGANASVQSDAHG
jgi:hypothetical protein